MINREIIYERTMTGSYMKIPVGIGGDFDERILLRKKIPGILSFEKNYLDGNPQYWYNISGKQPLETYCRMRDVTIEILEKLIISICNQLEILEWNLISTTCMVLDTDLIFISSDNQEFIFMIYPGGTTDINKEFRQLMEFLITKVDHKNQEAVTYAYGIYEKTLKGDMSLQDIRDYIISSKKKIPVEEEVEKEEFLWTKIQEEDVEPVKESFDLKKFVLEKLQTCKKNAKHKIESKLHRNSPLEIIYPNEVQEEKPQDYPTVLLSMDLNQVRGVLVYEGNDRLENISINKSEMSIGKGTLVDVSIEKDTISHFHAKIEKSADGFYLQDMNSKNGTFVNHEPIAFRQKRRLEKNDIVNFADIPYRFC